MLAKSVWITGASSGIGKALALLLDAQGYQLTITARNKEALDDIASHSKNISVLEADICNPDDIQKIKRYFAFRPLDIAILNAGTCEYMDNAQLDTRALRRVFELNLFGAAECIDAITPALKRSQHGHLIGISSMSVYVPFSRAEYYASSKSAFTYYLKSLAIDLKPSGVDVSIVYPGFVDTPLTQKNDFPMPFIISSEEAAQECLNVIEKKPPEYAFPKKMHILLKLMQHFPAYWFKQQVKSVHRLKEGSS